MSSTDSPATWDLRTYLRLRRGRDRLLRPISGMLARHRVSPVAISVLGVCCAASLSWWLTRSTPLALAAFLAALACDAVDGALARHQGSSSARGKVVDHLCDTATFLLVLLAIHLADLARAAPLLLLATLSPLLLALAVFRRRQRAATPQEGPSGGLPGHLHKVPVYVAVLIHTAGGDNVLDPSVRLALLTAIGSCALLLAASGYAVLAARDGHARSATGSPPYASRRS